MYVPTIEDAINDIRNSCVGDKRETEIALKYVSGSITLAEASELFSCGGKNPSATAYRKISRLLRQAFLLGMLTIKK